MSCVLRPVSCHDNNYQPGYWRLYLPDLARYDGGEAGWRGKGGGEERGGKREGGIEKAWKRHGRGVE